MCHLPATDDGGQGSSGREIDLLNGPRDAIVRGRGACAGIVGGCGFVAVVLRQMLEEAVGVVVFIDVALAARPSYIALGHVFPTQTKQMPSAPQGLTQLAGHVKRLADYPTVAIGGISLERAPAVLETGVGSIAVVSAITQAADWQAATEQLLQLAGAGDE